MPSLHWQKSSYSSEGNNCLELATAPGGKMRLRESDAPGIILTLPTPTAASLLAAARRGISTSRKA